MIRIIANMCMHTDVGIALVCGSEEENELMYNFDSDRKKVLII